METLNRKKLALDLLFPIVVVFCLLLSTYGILSSYGYLSSLAPFASSTALADLYHFFLIPALVSLCFVVLPLFFGAVAQIIKNKKSFPIAIAVSVVGLTLMLPVYFFVFLGVGSIYFFVYCIALYVVSSVVYHVITRLNGRIICVLFVLSILLLTGVAFKHFVVINSTLEERHTKALIIEELSSVFYMTNISDVKEYFDDKVLYCKKFSDSVFLEYCAKELSLRLAHSIEVFEIYQDKPIYTVISPPSKEFLCQKGNLEQVGSVNGLISGGEICLSR